MAALAVVELAAVDVALGVDIDIALVGDSMDRTNICVAALAVEPF